MDDSARNRKFKLNFKVRRTVISKEEDKNRKLMKQKGH